MTDKIYHVALIYGTGKTKFWGNNHNKSTCVLVASENLDLLPTDINEYLGERITTKKRLNANRQSILTWINGYFGKSFKRLIIQ